MLLLIIRVMDDVKDFEKDKIVHPERWALLNIVLNRNNCVMWLDPCLLFHTDHYLVD